ncbi:MAG: chemotaxis protein CheW [Gammaproteobacteria bacterium]|nr:chemotaxis protein CheW [Gammaproteobacteria bacterium]
MAKQPGTWMTPEEALTRFQGPGISLLDLDIQSQADDVKRYGFEIGDLGFLIKEQTICEVVKDFKIFPIPNTRSWMRGWINLRGNLIPVYDFALLFGLTEEPKYYQNLLILDKQSESIGILIEKLPKPCDVSHWQKLSHIPQMQIDMTDFILQTYRTDDRIWLDLEHKRFFESIKESIAI